MRQLGAESKSKPFIFYTLVSTDLAIILENVTVDDLLKWMAEPVDVNEDEYQKWKTEKAKQGKPSLKALLDKPKRTYVSGSDFRNYLSCARILYWNIHNPVQRKVYLNKGTFQAIKKHELIEERLESRGWYGEFEPKKHLPEYGLDGLGHVDCLSPSATFFLEIKHNMPFQADELQAAWYQYILEDIPKIVLVYRDQVKIIVDHSKYILKYIPRVCGTIVNNVLPPLHPSYPRCKGTCDYATRCGRPRRVTMHQGTPKEWIEYFKAIGAWRE